MASTFVLTADFNLFHLPLQSLHRAASTTEASFAREIVRLEELVELAQAPHVAQMVADEQRAAKILGQDVDPDPFDIEVYAADQLATATNALNDARKAFAISAYHRWEHAANRGLTALGLVGKKRPNTVVEIGQHLGWAVGRDMMGIQALVNLLKHNSTMAWGHLRTDWREMWDRAERSRTAADDGFADAVHLEKADLAFILDCVSKAGPPATRTATLEEIAAFERFMRDRSGDGNENNAG